jgi:hypothetical protein
MSIGEKLKIELTALSQFSEKLLETKEGLDAPIEEARQKAKDELDRLEKVREQRQQDVETCEVNVTTCEASVSACQSSLQNCLAYIGEDGQRPSCSGEATALRQAEADLRQAEIELHLAEHALRETEAHIATFQSQAEYTINSLLSKKEAISTSIDKARQELGNRIEKTIQYIKANDIAIPLTPGQDAHGGEYRKAKKNLYRRAAAGDFPNLPSHIRGWMEQEVNRGGGYYRSPGGGRNRGSNYDIGHRVRHLNVAENLVPENIDMNRARPGRRREALNNF